MDIEFVAFVKFDFHEVSEREEILDTLEDIYDEDGEVYGGTTLGSGGWQQRVFGNDDDNPLEEDGDIQWIRTIVESNIRGIIDVVTLGLVSREKVDEILAEEGTPHNEYNPFKSKLQEYIDDIPSIVENGGGLTGFITYIEPDEEFDIRTDGEVDKEKIQSIISENVKTLSRFDYSTGGYHTLYSGNHLITQSISMEPFSRISIFTTGIDREHNAPEELRTRPVWYSSIAGLISYFRAHYWSKYRRRVIGDFDEEINKNRDRWIRSLNKSTSTDTLLNTAHEIHDLQMDWVDIYSYIVDELGHLQFTFGGSNGNEGEYLWPHPIEIPPPDSMVIPTRPEGDRDLISIYEDDIRNRLELLDSEIERVDDKVRKLSSNLHDVITVGSTEENISLQQKIQTLTRVLVGLTVILVLIEFLRAGLL